MKKKSGELVNIWMPRGKTASPADKTQTRSDSPTLALHSTPAYKSSQTRCWVIANTQFNTKTRNKNRTKMQILKARKSVNDYLVSPLRFVRFLVTTSCRAVVLPRFGGPEVLEVRPNVEVPDLKPNEVLVRTRAVSINPLDTRVSEF